MSAPPAPAASAAAAAAATTAATTTADRPAPLAAVLAVTFFGSLSGGVFWASIFFVTKGPYGFSPTRNLALAGLMGVVYTIAAAGAGTLLRSVLRGITPRALLLLALGAWTAAAVGPVVAPHVEAVLWAGALLGAAASAVTWPVVESYLAAGRHGARMRAAIGWFNVTWTPATALALLLMPVVGRVSALGTLMLSAAGSAVALLAALALPPRPGAHEPAVAQAAVGPEYALLARSAAWLLPLSYVISSVIAPILPHRMAEVGGTSAGSEGAIAALWMIARVATLVIMWRTGFWHGRWGTLAAAAAALAGGLAAVLLAPTLAMLATGLVLYGVGMGLTYYASLYYAMAVGQAAVEAGGSFEARIGVGYFTGPALALVARAAVAPAHAASATVFLSWVTVAAGGWGALRPYLEARRRRIVPGAGAT